MVLVLLLALGIWVLGAWMRAPRAQRLVLIALLFGAVAVIQLTLPADQPLRLATGGSLANWWVVALLTLVVLGYRRVLKLLRLRANGATAAGKDASAGASRAVSTGAGAGGFSSTELDRYARHIILREVGGAGQRWLRDARVLVVGAGGLGSPALLYLAAAGVGTIGIIDDDPVEGSNLQRQVIHRDDTVGLPKVFSAEKAMRALNPFIEIRPYNRRLEAEIARTLIGDYDLVLDGTDNFETRYLVNRACVQEGVPLISAAITQWEGQLSLYHPAAGAPCYQCVFPQAPAEGLAPSCAEAGVIAPLPGVVGSMMALEAVKHLTGAGQTLAGNLLIYDGLYAETRRIAVAPRAECPTCRGGAICAPAGPDTEISG